MLDMRSVLEQIFQAQEKLNSKINPDWHSAARLKSQDFFLAASQELSEFQDSLGAYKWWSKTPLTHGQKVNCVMELIDAFHFGISADIAYKGLAYAIQHWIRALEHPGLSRYEGFNGLIDDPQHHALLAQLAKMLQAECLKAEDSFPRTLFLQLWYQGMGESFESLYLYYTGKSVLNTFRQDNGYKEGRYVKVWADKREDNAHLMEWLVTQKDKPISEENIKEWITAKYAEQLKLI